MKIHKRVYLVGSTYGSYRARALLEYLAASPKYGYYHNDPNFLISKSNSIFFRALFKGMRMAQRYVSLPYLLFSDIVYILPMENLHCIEHIAIRVFKKKIVGEFYISQYDTYVNDRKTIQPNTKKSAALLKLDQNFIDACDHVVFLNKAEREFYLELTNRKKAITKSSVTPLATNPKQKVKMPYANHSSDIIIICWWGTFIPLHGLEKIISSVSHLKEQGIQFKLYLFGTSEEKSIPYRKQIADLGLGDHIEIDNKKSFSDKSLDSFLIEHCDIAFGNFGDSEKAKTVMVNKVVEAASMALPVISQKTSALSEYFEDNTSIFFCESEPHAIAKKVLELSKDREKLRYVAVSSYQLYEKRFSKDSYLQDIIPILKKMTNA